MILVYSLGFLFAKNLFLRKNNAKNYSCFHSNGFNGPSRQIDLINILVEKPILKHSLLC